MNSAMRAHAGRPDDDSDRRPSPLPGKQNSSDSSFFHGVMYSPREDDSDSEEVSGASVVESGIARSHGLCGGSGWSVACIDRM